MALESFQVRIIFLPAIAVLAGLSIGYAFYLLFLNAHGGLGPITQSL